MILNVVLLILLFGLGVLTAINDIREGIIPNRWIAVFAIIGIIIDIIYYGFLARDIAGLFALNILTTVALSLVLFYTHSLAGGDCKLIIVMSILYPAGMYLIYGSVGVTLVMTVCIAIFYGYLYMIIISVWKLISGDNRIEKGYVKNFLKGYLKSYIVAFVIVTLVNLVCAVIDDKIVSVNAWIVWMLCIVLAWTSSKAKLLRNKIVIVLIVAVDIMLSVMMGVLPISLNPRTYIFTAILILCQMTIRTNLYETISTFGVRKGMILSTLSSMAMQNSRVKGLPGISNEDLSCRLTEEEADSIKRWGKTDRGLKEISVVKKIPFAVFIALGYASYFIIWRVVA